MPKKKSTHKRYDFLNDPFYRLKRYLFGCNDKLIFYFTSAVWRNCLMVFLARLSTSTFSMFVVDCFRVAFLISSYISTTGPVYKNTDTLLLAIIQHQAQQTFDETRERFGSIHQGPMIILNRFILMCAILFDFCGNKT